MDPPPALRTGFGLGGDHDAAASAMLAQVQALMLAFSEEACIVAGRCAVADGRRTVTARDMRGGLMYCARTFFDQGDDELRARVERAARLLDDEGSDGGEDSDDDEVGDGDEGSDDDEGEGSGGGDGGGDRQTADEGDDDLDSTPPEASAADVALRRHVQIVEEHWHRWHPTDPVHVLVKRAIDQTPCGDE